MTVTKFFHLRHIFLQLQQKKTLRGCHHPGAVTRTRTRPDTLEYNTQAVHLAVDGCFCYEWEDYGKIDSSRALIMARNR